MVGFGAGKENPHGVRAVTKGQRCAVALWFTLDPAHEEKVGRVPLLGGGRWGGGQPRPALPSPAPPSYCGHAHLLSDSGVTSLLFRADENLLVPFPCRRESKLRRC